MHGMSVFSQIKPVIQDFIANFTCDFCMNLFDMCPKLGTSCKFSKASIALKFGTVLVFYNDMFFNSGTT